MYDCRGFTVGNFPVGGGGCEHFSSHPVYNVGAGLLRAVGETVSNCITTCVSLKDLFYTLLKSAS